MRSAPDSCFAAPPVLYWHGSKLRLWAADTACFLRFYSLQESRLHSAKLPFSSHLSVVFLILIPFINSASIVKLWLTFICFTVDFKKSISRFSVCVFSEKSFQKSCFLWNIAVCTSLIFHFRKSENFIFYFVKIGFSTLLFANYFKISAIFTIQ